MDRASCIPHLLCEKINDILVGDLALADLSNVDSLAILQKLLEVDSSGSGLNADRLDNHEADEFAFVDLSNVSSNSLAALLDQIDIDAHTLNSHPLNDFMLKEDYLDAQGRVALASHALQADEASHATQADKASDADTLEGHPASDFALASHAHDDLYLNKSNDDPYTPTSPYNPATKNYVDDQVATRGDMFKSDYDPDNDGSVKQADDALTLDGHQPVTSPTPSSIPITDSNGYLNDFIDWDSLSLFVRKDGDTITGDLHVLASLLARILTLESAEGYGVEFEPTASNTLRLKGIDDPTECHLLLTTNNYEVWHSGNDGPGSGLNADLFDDLEADQLVRKDIADSVANEFLVRRGSSPDLGGRLYLQSPAETDLASDITMEAFSNYLRIYATKSNGMLAGYKFDIEQLEDGLHDVGDMLRSVYDPDKDGKVEQSDDSDLWDGSAKYVSPDDPDPNTGEDGDFWFQYECS